MKNTKVVTVVLVLIAFVIGYFVGDSTAIKRVNKQIDTKIANQKTYTKDKGDIENKTADENGTKQLKIYKVGEKGTCGNWEMKIINVKETNAIQGGSSSDNKTTKEKFIVINLEMKNISKQPVQYSANEFMLGNMKDKSQYSINDVAFSAMGAANSKETIFKNNSNFVGVYKDVNPNTTKQTYIVFEVPKNMKITDGVLINANAGSETSGFYLK